MYKQSVINNEVDFADWHPLFRYFFAYVTPAATV